MKTAPRGRFHLLHKAWEIYEASPLKSKSMQLPERSADILAMLAIDGQQVVKLSLIENEGTGAIFAPPPEWLEGVRATVDIPYRVMATLGAGLPVPASAMQWLLEWQWRGMGAEAPGKPGWFFVDATLLEEAVKRLLVTLSVPADAVLLVNRLIADARRNMLNPKLAGELWAAAHSIWGATGAGRHVMSPAEEAVQAYLEVIRQALARGQPEPPAHRVALDFFMQLAESSGSLGSGLANFCLQRYLGNKTGASDALSEHLFNLEKALDFSEDGGMQVEEEAVRLLKVLRRELVTTNEDCPELIPNLSLAFRENLVRLCEKRFDGDLTLLFWAKKQLVPSFFADPVYRRYIIGGMAVCLGIAAYLSLPTVLVLIVLGGLGYVASRKSG